MTPSKAWSNGWTGGQYSILRVLLGAACAVAFATSSSPHPFGVEMRVIGALLCVPFAIGWWDRVWAPCIALACVGLPTPAAALALPLLMHPFLPAAPYGSSAARGRVDPGGGWTFRPWVYAGAWMLLAVAVFVSGVGMTRPGSEGGLPSAIEVRAGWCAVYLGLAFGLLGWGSKARPVLWSVMAVAHAAVLVTFEFPVTIALLVPTFDPAWLRPRRREEPDLLFYDGTCGLCHRYVRLVLAEDTTAAFRLAPLDSDAFRNAVSDRESLPDSIIVRTADGRTLSRSSAIVRILSRLGGLWRMAGVALWLIPRPLRDLGYNAIAAIRYRLFARPVAACPILPPHLRERFLDDA